MTFVKKWIHLKCNKLDINDYKLFQNNPDFCINCMSDNLPFMKLNENEFLMMKKGIINSNEIDVNFRPTNFQEKIFNELNTAINNNAFELETDDDNEVNSTIDCNYYNHEQFLK